MIPKKPLDGFDVDSLNFDNSNRPSDLWDGVPINPLLDEAMESGVVEYEDASTISSNAVSVKCECGEDAIGGNTHSEWCSKSKYMEKL